MINKANGCIVHFQTWNKLEDYIKEIEICPQGQQINMHGNINSASKSKSSDSDVHMSIDPNTEPIGKIQENLLCNESIHSIKNYTPNQKINKSTKLVGLNTLSGLLGNLDWEHNTQNLYNQPEIIFHSAFWPLPSNISKHNGISYSSNEEKSSSEYSCHNPEWKHEKALCRVFNEAGNPIPFKDICSSHPCYLIMPQTPDSKMNSSAMQNSTPENHYEMRQRHEYLRESPEILDCKQPTANYKSAQKSRKRGKNILRLKRK